MAERLEPRTSIPEVPGSSPGPAVAPLGKALYPHCLVFRRRPSVPCIGEKYPMHVKNPLHSSQRVGRNPGEVARQYKPAVIFRVVRPTGHSYKVNFSPPWQTRRLSIIIIIMIIIIIIIICPVPTEDCNFLLPFDSLCFETFVASVINAACVVVVVWVVYCCCRFC